MPFTRFASSILQSNQDVVASDLTVDSQTVTVDTVNDRLGVNTATPLGTLGIDGDLYFQPDNVGISTSHVYTAGSLDIRATDNIKLGTDDADSVRIGRVNTTAAKVHIRSGADTDFVVSNSMVGIGTETPTQALELDGNIQLSPTAISTAHLYTAGSLDVRATANIKIGTDGADSVKIGRTNSTAAKCHIRSGADTDLVVSNSKVGIGTDTPSVQLDVVGTANCTESTNGEALPIVAKNADDTDAANAAVGYGFDLETTAGATVNSAKIVAKKKESFTATASTQDAKLEFYVTKNGTQNKQMTLQGGNELRFSNSNSSLTVADSSGDNQAGKNIVIEAGAGTGSGVPGKFEVKVSQPTGTAADVQTHNSAIVADGNGVSIYTGNSLAALANDTGFGEIIYWGTEDGTDSLAAGRLMSLNTSGVWKYADADAVATTNTLLAIALGSAVSDGLLVKGYFKLNSYIEGSFAKGAPCFVSEASGEIDFTAPSAAGDVLRIVGHGTSETNVILFDPSNDYVEL